MRKPDRSPFQPGTLVGKYRLVRRLGRGGMGDVHVAEGTNGPPVALKLMTTLVGDLALQNERFVREAEALKVLRHPAIVRVLDHGFDPVTATPFLVMELLEGEDLGARLDRGGPLAEDEVVAIGLDLAAGLAEAHAQRLVHRDVKPPNVILPRDPGRGVRAVLCDFGLAKRVDMATSLTQTGALVGTPHFMSPEQFLDAKRVSELSDVFSLALTLLNAYAGKNPLAEARTTTALMMALCTRSIPRVEELVPPARAPSRVFSEALRRALATDPQERSSLADFRRELAAASAAPVSVPAPRTLPLGALGAGPATSRRSVAPGRAARSNRPELREPVRLAQGTYRFKKELAPNVYSGVDADARPVRLERLGALVTTREGEAALTEEATAFGAVLTESVLALLDQGREGDDGWLVTETWSGPTLVDEIAATGPLPYARALASFTRLARGLTALHDAGVVHGFLGPESFHFRKVGKRKVLVLHDLGILKRVEARLRATSSKRGSPKRDPRADVVQVVSTLYFAAIGKVPFGARVAMPAAVGDAAHATHAAPDPRGRVALDDLVRRTIEGKVGTLTALADELDGLLAQAASL